MSKLVLTQGSGLPQPMTTCPGCGKWTHLEAVVMAGSDGITRRYCTATPVKCETTRLSELAQAPEMPDPDSKIFDPFDAKRG